MTHKGGYGGKGGNSYVEECRGYNCGYHKREAEASYNPSYEYGYGVTHKGGYHGKGGNSYVEECRGYECH